MSEWITDREPTEADGNPYVWVTTEHGVVLRQSWDMVFGRPWQPIVPPEPYVKPVADTYDGANACLIAAAPELLEVLEAALDESGCDGDLCAHEWHEIARSAIAKAKGEQP